MKKTTLLFYILMILVGKKEFFGASCGLSRNVRQTYGNPETVNHYRQIDEDMGEELEKFLD